MSFERGLLRDFSEEDEMWCISPSTIIKNLPAPGYEIKSDGSVNYIIKGRVTIKQPLYIQTDIHEISHSFLRKETDDDLQEQKETPPTQVVKEREHEPEGLHMELDQNTSPTKAASASKSKESQLQDTSQEKKRKRDDQKQTKNKRQKQNNKSNNNNKGND